jgi:hypothetical protein
MKKSEGEGSTHFLKSVKEEKGYDRIRGTRKGHSLTGGYRGRGLVRM